MYPVKAVSHRPQDASSRPQLTGARLHLSVYCHLDDDQTFLPLKQMNRTNLLGCPDLDSEQKHFSAAAGRLIESVTHWQSGLSSLIRALSWPGDCSVLCHRRSLSVIQLITSDRSQCFVGVSMARWFLVWRVPHTGRTNRRSGGILLKSKCPISTSGWMCRGETEIWVCWTWDCVWVCGVCCSDSWTCWRPATQQVNITFLIKCSSLWFVLFSTLIAD